MRIGIIGAGHVGGTLAQLLAKHGHEVMVANSRGPQTLHGLVDRISGEVSAGTAAEAAEFGDVVVTSVPFGRYPELPTGGLADKTVVDTTNYYPERDGHYPDLDQGSTTSSELVQAHLAGAHLVKAFNTMYWEHLRDYGRQSSAQFRYALPVSGDDDQAKRTVQDLVEQLGFEPVDTGTLADGGRRQQPGSPIYGADLSGDELRSRIRH
ncbi:NAD(P)-binding domain-containing protein [Micromonospora sonneratiae]|uniref:NADPH-dependent F420 reductase n=1 Tax=Micromonospora sonneratiae TaxID=1184706 RepID=A0ABW3Y8D8_9ACTN